MYKVNPCVDDFELDQNRSCSVCKRVVLDLIDKSEEDILNLYHANNGNLCGSVKSSYFNASYYLHPFKRFAFSILLVFGSSLFVLDAFAQDSIQAIQQENIIDSVEQSSYLIRGTVKDENGEVVFAAKVYAEVNGVMYGCATNFDGEYQFKVSANVWTSISLEINCKSIGFGFDKILINRSKENIYLVDFILDNAPELMLMGMVCPSSIIDNSPDAHRYTTIKSNEIKRLPRK